MPLRRQAGKTGGACRLEARIDATVARLVESWRWLMRDDPGRYAFLTRNKSYRSRRLFGSKCLSKQRFFKNNGHIRLSYLVIDVTLSTQDNVLFFTITH